MTDLTAVFRRPILFSGAMVRAILEGRKAQTRRVIKPEWSRCLDLDDEADRAQAAAQCPYGFPGVRLWVRETWAVRDSLAGPRVEYQADGESAFLPTHHDIRDEGGKVDLTRYVADRWRPSIHMPRWASRITLEVTDVRVERVKEIGGADAIAEGVKSGYHGEYDFHWVYYDPPAIANFRRLWDSINAARGYGWNDNPWVWVVEFRRV